jgi:hypothetical protein
MLNPAHASRRYSSVFQNKFYMSLLGDSLGARAWRPAENKIGEWMEIDLGESMQLQGIVVEGIPQSNEWVTNFNLECRETIDATLNTTLVNFSQVSPSRQDIFLATPVSARYVRVVVLAWNSHISMQLSLIVKRCIPCFSNSTSPPQSVSPMSCDCPTGSFKGETQNSNRAIALVPGRAQLATLSNRRDLTYSATAQYNTTDGPTGSKGAVTFDKNSAQYIDGGQHEFKINTNGGFTALAVVKFRTVVGWEMVFDFGNGRRNDNIYVSRWGTSNHMQFSMRNANDNCAVRIQDVIAENTWLSIMARYESSSNTLELRVGDKSEFYACNSRRHDRILNYTYVGRLQTWGTSYFDGSIAGLYVIDSVLGEHDVSSIISNMYKGDDALLTCVGCPRGTYGMQAGLHTSDSCTKCKKGTYSESVGGASSRVCTPCSAGKHHREIGAGTENMCRNCNC